MNRKLTSGRPSPKKILGLALITILAVVSANATIHGLRLWSGSASCSILTLLYVFIYTRALNETSKYCKIGILVFSLVFSLACVQGSLLRINGETYTGLVKENYMGYFGFRDAADIVILTFTTYYVIRLSLPWLQKIGEFLRLKRPEGPGQLHSKTGTAEEIPNEPDTSRQRRNRLFSKKWKHQNAAKTRSFLYRHRSMLLPMTGILLCWLPYFIAYYPGFILGDSCSSIRQALGLEEFSNHYPVMYTLYIRLCLSIGEFFGSLTLGCAVYSLIQMVFLAYALARMIQWLWKRGLPWQLCMLLTVYFGFTAFFAQVSIAMWKDPVFSAAILLWTLLLLDHVRLRKTGDTGKPSRHFRLHLRFFLKNTGLVLLICFSRNNGIYIALFCTVVFFLVMLFSGKRRKLFDGLKEAIACTMLVILFCELITGPVYEAAGVKPVENVERVGVMMNQMARTVALSGKMSKEDKTFMNRLLPLKKYKKAYRPCVVDLLKWDDDFDGDYLNEHMDEFYTTWFSMALKNPRSYFQAWELLTFGYWMPNQWELFYDDTNIIKGNLYDLPSDDKLKDKIHTAYGGKKLKTGLRMIFDSKGTIAGLGFVSWILLFALLITVIRKEWTALIALMPSLSLFLTLLLASPYYYWQRYGLAEYFLFPIYLYIIFCFVGKTRTAQDHPATVIREKNREFEKKTQTT